MDQLAHAGSNHLLSRLTQVDFALLAPHLKEMRFDQGAVLQETDELSEYVFFPRSGMVSLLTVMRDGRGVESLTVGREGAVNITAGMCSRRSACRAVMQIEGDVLQIAAARFRIAVDSSALLRDLVVRYNDIQMAHLQQTVGCNALHHVKMRICRWLLEIQDRSDTDEFPLTQEFLSEMLGVQRTTVTSIARALQVDGVIRYRRGRIAVLDRQALESRSCECYETTRTRNEGIFS
jgi:CRP-like cAMP-binding protein